MATNSAPPDPDLPKTRKPLRTRPLWQLFGWGSAACIALAAVALTSQTEAGSKRLQLALSYGSEPVHVVAVIPPRASGATAEAETMRLAAQLRDLATDREQLKARIAMLERNLEDMTGSIKLQSEQLAAARAAAVNTPQLELSAPATTPAFLAPATPPASALPVVMPPAMPLGSVLPTLAPLAMPALKVTAASWPATKPEPEKPAAQANAADSEMNPLSCRRSASPPRRRTSQSPNRQSRPKMNSASTWVAPAASKLLRIHWATLKANYGPLLVGLHPVATQHPRTRPASLIVWWRGRCRTPPRRLASAPAFRFCGPVATRPSSSARNWPRTDCRRAGASA